MKPMATYWRFRSLRLALLRWIRERNEVLPAPSDQCRRHWGDSYMKTLRTGRF
jgi:hypothetical protein